MSTFHVTWRDGPVPVEVPDRNLLTVVSAPELPTLGTPLELVRHAVERPVGSPSLRELIKPGDRVALLVTDTVDRWMGPPHQVGPFLLDLLNACGVPDGRITLVHAAGMHGHFRARQKLGEGWLHRVRYVEHHPEEDLTFLGTTPRGTPVWVNRCVAEADAVVGVGSCAPSLFGYHGGAGIVLPGASGRDTIRHNHSYILASRPLTCWGPGNPMREDVMDAGDLAGFTMKVDFTANAVFAGPHRSEWPAALRYLQEKTMTPVDGQADIYVFAPEPSPQLGAIYMKIEMCEQVLREGGIGILLLSGAEQPALPGWSVERCLRETVACTDAWMRDTDERRADPEAHARDALARLELMRLPLEDLARIVTRREGEPRSTTMSWSHKRSLCRRRVFLVSEGISEAEGEAFGFAYVARRFSDALGRAFQEMGRDARIVVSLPPRPGIPLPPQDAVSPQEAEHGTY